MACIILLFFGVELRLDIVVASTTDFIIMMEHGIMNSRDIIDSIVGVIIWWRRATELGFYCK